MLVGLAAVGQIVHLPGVPGGEPLVEPSHPRRRNGGRGAAQRKTKLRRPLFQFGRQFAGIHAAILTPRRRPRIMLNGGGAQLGWK